MDVFARPGEVIHGVPWLDNPTTVVLTLGDLELEQDWIERTVEVDHTLRKGEERGRVLVFHMHSATIYMEESSKLRLGNLET